MLDTASESYIAKARPIGLDKDTLRELASLVLTSDKIVLLGFNDYAKHLINMFPGRILMVIDEKYDGIQFRGIQVQKASGLPDCDQLVVCAYEKLFTYKCHYYADAAKRKIKFSVASKYGTERTKVLDFLHLDPLYQSIWAERSNSPSSMMSDAGMFFLLELLRNTLSLPGSVAEVGAWQGGSAWHIAKVLKACAPEKDFHVFDIGEKHAADNPQGIVSEEQMVRDLAFYPNVTCHFGPAISALKSLEPKDLCFCFIDFGFNNSVMETCYDMVVPGGILLLDNYGHVGGHPDQFDAFFEARGTRVVRQSKSPVAFSIKR